MQLGGYGVLGGGCALGGGKPRLQSIHETLNRARGTGYDTTSASPVWAENMAAARAVESIYCANDRLGNVTDPMRTCFLARWEKMFGITPPYGATDYSRRLALAECWSRMGDNPVQQLIIDKLKAALGNVFVAYYTIPLTLAVISVIPWTGTSCHVLIKVQVPSGYTPAQFYAALALINPIMEWALPAHSTFDWYLDCSVVGGGGFWPDTSMGFLLDDFPSPSVYGNLDTCCFDA